MKRSDVASSLSPALSSVTSSRVSKERGRVGIPVWIYESREAWERLWGSLEAPRRPAQYPKTWRVWENEVLAPFLIQHPDTIRFTSYEEL
jgi:hypothetical protein